MQTIILKDNLKKALGVLERVTRKTLTLPVLQNVLIEVKTTVLKLITTNLETTITWQILVKTEKEGRLAVPATFLANLVNLITDEKIELNSNNQNLVLKTKNQTTQVKGQNPEDFPIIPKIEEKDPWQINSEIIFQALSQIVDVPSVSQIRPEISGVYFNLKKDILKIAATDSFRLAEKTIKLENKSKKDDSFILTQNTARELINLSTQQPSTITVFSSPNQILFRFVNQQTSQNKVEVLSRLIEGQYPNYKEIIPKKWQSKIQIKKQEFENQIKKAGLFSGRVLEVRITVLPQQKQIKIFSQSAEAGQNEAFLTCQTEGEPIEAAFNYRFLVDGLANIKSAEVILEFSPEDGPAALKPVGDASYIYILMPIKNT